MKILVLADSHCALHFMRQAIRSVHPDAVVHLGDYYEDGQTMAEENPGIPFHIVPGNCDRLRLQKMEPEVLCYDVCGVRLFMTHGHLQKVKQTRGILIRQAREMEAAAALYGHTHCPDCYQEDGMWILNPGTCGTMGGSVGLIETDNHKITSCRILRQEDLEALL